jgi:hypothetical protein
MDWTILLNSSQVVSKCFIVVFVMEALSIENKQEKLKPGASSSGRSNMGTNGPMDRQREL